MIDPDLQKQLETINSNLVEIKTKKNGGIGQAFFNGIFSALGYMVGIVVVVVILGWFLNKTGLLPEFKSQIKNFESFMVQAKSFMNTSQDQQGSGQQGR